MSDFQLEVEQAQYEQNLRCTLGVDAVGQNRSYTVVQLEFSEDGLCRPLERWKFSHYGSGVRQHNVRRHCPITESIGDPETS